MDLSIITDELTSNSIDNNVKTHASGIAEKIQSQQLKIVDMIKGLNAVLTNGSHEIRCRGIDLLAQVLTTLPQRQLTEKEIEVLTEFICLRLIDHKSMELSSLKCLSYFVECNNKPIKYNRQVLEFFKSKVNLKKMEAKTRHKVYEIVKKIVFERKKLSNAMDGDFIYSLVTILEGENNPDNLMICFSIVAFTLKNFDELEPYIDDIFEWLSSYYPIDYTPAEVSDQVAINIQRSDLVEALYECFYANDLNAENLQTLLLEKLESSALSTKLESLECLIKCYEKPFPLQCITKYNSTLWTALRMSCLKNLESLDTKLLETSLNTLTALAKRLTEDRDLYFTFTSDMYEELAIAFRKPEMGLFEPACRLLTHAILPSIVGFNYVLSKILPISLNALEANELRTLPGLTYIFSKLHVEHPNDKLQVDLNENINKLVLKAANLVKAKVPTALLLLESLICHHVTLDEQSLTKVVNILLTDVKNSPLDLKRCLALICANYKKHDIITDSIVENCDLDTLLKLVYQFNPSSTNEKLAIYLRLLMLELNSSRTSHLDSMDQTVLNDCLQKLRDLLMTINEEDIVEESARIHAIILNKVETKNADKILMTIFSSRYCQELTSSSQNVAARKIYLPHIKWIFKALVIRNHHLATPLINLVLNCVTSDKVSFDLACDTTKVFSFVLKEEEAFASKELHYRIFYLFKQKFYSQTSKEIRLRLCQQVADTTKKNLLVYTIVSQLPHIPLNVYKKDFDWLVRQLLCSMSSSTKASNEQISDENQTEEKLDGSFVVLRQDLYNCLEVLIHKDSCDELVSFLPSLVELNLNDAKRGASVQLRRQALVCLAKVATSFRETDLLVYRVNVVDSLRDCLSDRKRLVRQEAAETRLRWVMVGQPVGSSR